MEVAHIFRTPSPVTSFCFIGAALVSHIFSFLPSFVFLRRRSRQLCLGHCTSSLWLRDPLPLLQTTSNPCIVHSAGNFTSWTAAAAGDGKGKQRYPDERAESTCGRRGSASRSSSISRLLTCYSGARSALPPIFPACRGLKVLRPCFILCSRCFVELFPLRQNMIVLRLLLLLYWAVRRTGSEAGATATKRMLPGDPPVSERLREGIHCPPNKHPSSLQLGLFSGFDPLSP